MRERSGDRVWLFWLRLGVFKDFEGPHLTCTLHELVAISSCKPQGHGTSTKRYEQGQKDYYYEESHVHP